MRPRLPLSRRNPSGSRWNIFPSGSRGRNIFIYLLLVSQGGTAKKKSNQDSKRYWEPTSDVMAIVMPGVANSLNVAVMCCDVYSAFSIQRETYDYNGIIVSNKTAQLAPYGKPYLLHYFIKAGNTCDFIFNQKRGLVIKCSHEVEMYPLEPFPTKEADGKTKTKDTFYCDDKTCHKDEDPDKQHNKITAPSSFSLTRSLLLLGLFCCIILDYLSSRKTLLYECILHRKPKALCTRAA